MNAWDFGIDEQFPALNYADYDGPGTVFDCSQFLAPCDTLLPVRVRVNAAGLSAVLFGATTTITGSLFGSVTIEIWSWKQLQGPPVTLMGGDTRVATFRAPDTGTLLLFELTATDSMSIQYTDSILISLGASVDADGDGLIEIDSLTMLHNMRHNLVGTSYRESADAPDVAYGCPVAGCRGYELTGNLDFDTDGDGTWSGNAEDGFTLDSDDSQADYFPVNGSGTGGWLPIGDDEDPFVAVFDGNGHTISHLAIRRDQDSVGLFGAIGGRAAIRNLGLIDNLADYTGSSDESTFIGGLVGYQSGGMITASYATGAAAGGDGDDDLVGGLVGYQSEGMITASYATGAAAGGDGNDDLVGGLVGRQAGGSITASYATGDVDGGAGESDLFGGLVGRQDGGSITASYATGDADGGDGGSDEVGGLVGRQAGGSITASYGFGEVKGETRGVDGSAKPEGVMAVEQLTAANAGEVWNSADNNTLDAWDFGIDEQFPALNYADYDGTGTVFVCSQFPAPCGTLLPVRVRVNAAGLSAVVFGAATTITGSLFGSVTITTWSWKQLQGTTVILMGGDTRVATFMAPADGDFLEFELTATDSMSIQYTDRILISLVASVDHDGDGLIEIDSLTMLHNMRYNLTGTSYRESADAPGATGGCPAAGCRGYELTEDLDFDTNGNGTWSGNAEDGFTLDADDSQAGYFSVSRRGGNGWRPIGDFNNPFVAEFNGNGHTISHLAIRRNLTSVGLFGVIGGGAAIRNLGLIGNLADYTGSSSLDRPIGGLVGWQQGGSITASYATGPAAGGRGAAFTNGDNDAVGGLVGRQTGGSITASYATGAADGRNGRFNAVGGLVGWQEGGSITASYATGDADGGDGASGYVGGLVGRQSGGSITASYATGAADGGDGASDEVGGLVGRQAGGSITASYATGAADGGDGASDRVGRLVGLKVGTITASYGFGEVHG